MEQFGYSNTNLHIPFMCFVFEIPICNVFENSCVGISDINEERFKHSLGKVMDFEEWFL